MTARTTAPATPIAIIGIGCAFPKAADRAAYWANVRDGVDAITDVPPTHWDPAEHFDPDPTASDKTYGRRGGFLDPIDFHPLEFGIAPRDIEATDTTQLLGLHCARRALEDAGYGPGARAFDRETTGVVLGVTGALELVIPLGARLGHPIWRRALNDAGVATDVADDVVRRISDSYVPWQENSFPGLLGNVVAGRIANRLDLHGTNCVVDAACASSLSALHLAALELEVGRADMVLAGGLDTFNDVFMYTCFSKTPALSPTQDARPFAQDADGTILGEGVGVVVLKRLADAQAAGDRIYAVVRGIGSSSDGKGKAIYAPDAAGQARALRAAYRVAGVEPRTVDLIEAHGTGTRVGDATEAAGLCEVFSDANGTGPWCALGSVKSMVGHTKAAAGVAGLIKVAMALHHKVLPPTLKVETPNDAVAPGATPFYVNTTRRPWRRRGGHPRRAGVSAFGFGGSNFHCVLEERDTDADATDSDAVDWDGRAQIFAFSAADPDALLAQLRAVPTAGDWQDVRRLAAQTRARFDGAATCRLTLVAERDGPALSEMVDTAASSLAQQSGDRWLAPTGIAGGRGPARGKLAALFPGQGAQYVGMLRDLACGFSCMRQPLENLGDLADAIYPPPAFDRDTARSLEADLRATDVAQPAIGAVSFGALRVLRRFGVTPHAAVGHSYGELVALCAAGSLPGDRLADVSRKRGELMAQLGGERGSMLAVAADLDTVTAAIGQHALDVVVANRNAPRQMVLSGATAAIERAHAVLEQAGHRCTRLRVAAAFHSPLVAAARAPFFDALQPVLLSAPRMPVYANATAAPYPSDPARIRSEMSDQLVSPVEFVGCIRRMATDGVDTFVEVGPGRRLSGLVDDILGDAVQTVALDASSSRRSGFTDLARALGALAAWGHRVELDAWDPAAAALPQPDREQLKISVCGAHPRPTPDRRPPVAHQPERADPAMSKRPPPATDALKLSQDNLAALMRLQEQTADLHRRFLEGQEQATRAFAALAAQQQTLLGAVPVPDAVPVPVPAPVPDAAPVPDPVPDAVPVPVPAPVPDIGAILREVVADKTGYPPEMIELDMGLDSDLGIDSIKRVEILSALAERLPDLPKVAPEQLGELHTLAQIVAFLGGGANVHPAPSTPAPEHTPDDVASLLLAVVSDKTGYPPEMLDLNMGLDADLGIDSIKRVEILSTLSERLPGAPTVDPARLADLQTLADVATFLSAAPAPLPVPVPVPAPVPASPAASPAPSPAPLLRRDVTFTPLPALPTAPVPPRQSIAIFAAPEDPLAQAIAEQLSQHNAQATLLPLGSEAPRPLTAAIVVAPPDPPPSYCRRAFATVRALTGSIQLLATVSRLDGRFGLDGLDPGVDPDPAGLAGLAKTAHHEWPSVRCRAIDLDPAIPPAPAAQQLVDMLWSDAPLELGIGSAQIGTPTLRDVEPAPSGGVRWDRSDVVLVTGGARGVTAAVSRALASPSGPRMVLVGRSPAPSQEPAWLATATDAAAIQRALVDHAPQRPTPRALQAECARVVAGREIRATLGEIERVGGSAIYRSVDVRDASAVQGLVEWTSRELGPVTGLIHGAGVLADRRIVDKTDEDFEAVYTAKATSLEHLLGALDDAPLRGIAMFSSSTGRFGRAGQADYAMANEVVNKIAQVQRRRRPSCRVVSVAWGPWDGGMVTPAHKTVFAREGIEVIGLGAGAELLVRELAGSGPTEVVVLGAGSRIPDALPTPAVADLPTVYERTVAVETHPALAAHVLGGQAVVPTVLMLEWMAHAALHGHPGLKFAGCDDLRVLKGVRLRSGESIDLRVGAGPAQRDGATYVVPVQLISGGGNGHRIIHAQTQIVLAPAWSSAPETDVPVLTPHHGTAEALYRRALFHGELLQGITAIEGLDDTAIVARCRAAAAPGEWMAAPARGRWIADPLALDCGMQAVIAWSFERLGQVSLPNRWGRLRQFAPFPRTGTRVVARIRRHTAHEAVADLDWVDDTGAAIARLTDYRCTIDPSLSAAFDNTEIESVATARRD